MRTFFLTLLLLSGLAVSAQTDTLLERELLRTGYIHRPIALDRRYCSDTLSARKQVLASLPVDIAARCRHYGLGSMRLSGDAAVLVCPNVREGWRNSDHAVYGNSMLVCDMEGADWREYNRLAIDIYTDCEGARSVCLNLHLRNDGERKIPDEYGREGYHEINLVNGREARYYLEINELPRDRITQLSFEAVAFGKDLTMGDSLRFEIRGVELQRVASPEIESGWMPREGSIIHSMSGYSAAGAKTAVVNVAGAERFALLDTDGRVAYSGRLRRERTTTGEYSIADFTDFDVPGEYRLRVGDAQTERPFAIGGDVWRNSVVRVLNFVFCQRCGFPVAGKHSHCHDDIYAEHDGLRLSYSGGWHDAGDLSQQSLQTGELVYALLEAAGRYAASDPMLGTRLMEEAEWGLDFVLRCRFGDGYRASSAGMALWSDGLTGNEDDTPARVHNNPFDNYMFAAIEAYAAMTLPDDDPAMTGYLRRCAVEDFDFAEAEDARTGYGDFTVFWEHSYNTSRSTYVAAACWAASTLYELTGEKRYAERAAALAGYLLECQQREPVGGIAGFFYRDSDRRVATHFNHQSREQLYMQALTSLCRTQPDSPDYGRWIESVRLYGDYLKSMMRYTAPYGMIPSGVYRIDEGDDRESFARQHLLIGESAYDEYKEQLRQGVRLDDMFYLKRFPVWFSFRGNGAVHLASGKAAALCASLLGDEVLADLAEEQLRWVVGKNPFGVSMIYGEGYNYPQYYAALPGETVGEIPVGIQTRLDEDIPYFPHTNNATYKEIWLTTAIKWLSLAAEMK